MKNIFSKKSQENCCNETNSSCVNISPGLVKEIFLRLLNLKFNNPEEVAEIQRLYEDCGFSASIDFVIETAVITFVKINFIGEDVREIA